LLPGEPARLVRLDGATAPAQRWSLVELAPLPDYVGALAVEGTGFRLCCWHWQGE
jgi:4'-phosphopantetheinyl transferase